MSKIQLSSLPVFGVSGWSGSGKTTLLKKVVSAFRKEGFSICVIKHDVHGISVDSSKKDSDIFFKAGVDVCLKVPHQEFFRSHGKIGQNNLELFFKTLSQHYDLIFVEGFKYVPFHKVWLAGPNNSLPPQGVEEIIAVLDQGSDLRRKFLAILRGWFIKQWKKTPIFGCIFFPPQPSASCEIKHENKTIFLKNLKLLKSFTQETVLITNEVQSYHQSTCHFISPIPEIPFPFSVFLASQRWAPSVSWLFLNAFDSSFSGKTLKTLLRARAPGKWVFLPTIENLFSPNFSWAYCDPRARFLFEQMSVDKTFRGQEINENFKIFTLS